MRSVLPKAARRFVVALLLILLASACTGLGGEPEIVATLPREAQVPREIGYPTQPPDVAAGAQTFAARCVSCHGLTGAGDGELVRTGQVTDAADFTIPQTARNQTPQEWFTTITEGNLAALMPPWRDSLSEAERWDVALYTYTLHYSPEQIERGQGVWTSICGDACDTLSGIGSLTDLQVMVAVSDAGLRAALPDTVSEDDAWAAVAWLRTQALQNVDTIGQTPPQPVTTEEARVEAAQAETPQVAAPQSITGAITGQITNGTAGGEIPEGLPVRLFTWDAEFNLSTTDTVSDANGVYRFDDAEIGPSNAYAVTADYRERRFASDLVRGDASSDTLDLPITIFELTEDPSVITITGMVDQITAVGTGLQIVQVINLQNTSDRVYTTSTRIDESRFASVVLSLPPGASVLGFPNNEQRFIVSEDQGTVADTVPVIPGQDHIIQMVYLVPYTGDAIIEYPVNYALDGEVRVLLRPEALEVISPNLDTIGPQVIGENTYTGFGGNLTLNADEAISYEVRGDPAPTAERLESPTITGNNLVLVTVIIVIGLALIIAALVLYYRQRGERPARPKKRDRGKLIDALAQQIAELDEAHDRGEINHDLYQRQRQQLKARLAEAMSEADERD